MYIMYNFIWIFDVSSLEQLFHDEGNTGPRDSGVIQRPVCGQLSLWMARTLGYIGYIV